MRLHPWRALRPVLLLLALVGCSTDPALPDPPAPPATSSTSSTAARLPTSTVRPATTSSTTSSTTTTTLPPLEGLAYRVVAEGLSQPLLALPAPGEERLYVVERPGTVRTVEEDGTVAEEPFLDIRDQVADNGIEQGLLGLAFHPDHARNGRLFAYYVGNDDNSRLVEYRREPGAPRVDPATERLLLAFDQAIVRHYGGMLRFAPDGTLFLSLGEGGAASVHSQDPTTLLSAILRIDVDGGDPYAVPPDNPFLQGGGAPEVWAYGLRNPWRFDIDEAADLLYVADVGHEEWEELNAVPLSEGGHNFGWVRMEGEHCFQPGCDPEREGLTLPVHEYSHEEGCSITGGFVYRGAAIPELHGEYLFSDWCAGWLRSYRHEDGRVHDWTSQVGEVGQVNGFGIDHLGELSVLTWDGRVVQIVPERAPT